MANSKFFLFGFMLIFITCVVISSITACRLNDLEVRTFANSSSVYSEPRWPIKIPKWSYETSKTVNVVSISSNGNYLVIGTNDGYVYLFNPNNNIPISAVNVGDSVTSLEVSNDGKYVILNFGNKISFYNISEGYFQFLWSYVNDEGTIGYVGRYSLAFSSNGTYAVVGTSASCGDRGWGQTWVHVFDIPNKVKLWSFKVKEGQRFTDYVTVDLSDDGNYIIAGSTANNKVYLFNRNSSSPIQTYLIESSVSHVAISAEGQYYVAASNTQLYYFKYDVYAPLWSRNLGGTINFISLSSDGMSTACAVKDEVILIYADNSIMWRSSIGTNVNVVTFSGDDNWLIAMSGNYVLFFNSIESKPVWCFGALNTVNSVSISYDGKYCVAASGSLVHFFDADFNANLRPLAIEFSNSDPGDGEITTISAIIRNEGNLNASRTYVNFYDNEMLLANLFISLIPSGSDYIAITPCVFSPSGEHEITVNVDPYNLVYESNETDNTVSRSLTVRPSTFIDTGDNPIITEVTQTSTVNSISLSGNGYYTVIGTNDNYVYLYFRNFSRPVWLRKFEDPIRAIDIVDICESGSYIAVADGAEGNYASKPPTLYIFSRANYRPLWNFTLDIGDDWVRGGVYSLAFSSDGKYLVVGTWGSGYKSDTWVYFLEVPTGALLWGYQVSNDLMFVSDYVSVDISSDGNYIIAGSSCNNQVYLFNKTSANPVYTYKVGESISSVSISESGDYFVVGSDKLYYFSKNIIVPLWSRDLGGAINSVSISGEATYIAAVRGTCLYLLKNDSTELWNYDVKESVGQTLISKDGNYIILRSGNHVYLFSRTEDGDLSTPAHEPLWSYDTKDTVKSISISSNGRYSGIASGGKIYYFDALHKADLVLTNVTFSDDTPNEDDVILVNATIYNKGTHKSYYANVSFYDSSVLIGNVRIGTLSPNSQTTASVSYVCKPGCRVFKVVVDEENKIYESDETNNQMLKTLCVNARPVPVTLNDPTDATSTSIRLSWSKNTELDFARYEIYMSTSHDEIGSVIASIADQTETSYVVNNLTASTTYYFIVRVVDSYDAFSDSNQVNATTLPTPVVLNNPVNPTPVSLDLSWTKNNDLNFERYEIYKSTSPEKLGILVATIEDQTITAHRVTGLDPSTIYYFVVRVINPQGLFSDSNQVRGTTATADFNLIVTPSSQVVIPGDTASYVVNVTSQWGFPVQLAISELPTNVTSSFNPHIVTPNGTSMLRIATAPCVAGGSYIVTVTGKSGGITHTETITLVIIEISLSDVKQEKTNIITFSLVKTLEESQSFSLEGVTVALSVRADVSLTMPVEIIAQSNATDVGNNTGAWMIITMNGKTATIKVTLDVTVKIADLLQSITKTWEKSFTTPLGTSEIIFDKFSIPALDTIIGQVTIDLTPRAVLQGYITGNITVNGPGTLNKRELQWTTQGSQNAVYVTFNEDKDVEVYLSSSTLSLTKLTIIVDVGASLKSVIGSKSFDLGSLPLPISITISTEGSPDAVNLAKFSGSRSTPIGPLLPTELWVYIIPTLVIIVGTIIATLIVRKRRKTIAVAEKGEL